MNQSCLRRREKRLARRTKSRRGWVDGISTEPARDRRGADALRVAAMIGEGGAGGERGGRGDVTPVDLSEE